MKSYSDTTLMKWTKEQLIGMIRCLEHNLDVAHEMNTAQYVLLQSYMDKEDDLK